MLGPEAPYFTQADFRAADFAWMYAPDRVHAGSFAMKLRAADLLKLGQLYLDEGRWEGRQIVPAEWVRESTAADSPSAYGLLWWIHPVQGQHGFAAIGSNGQLILVMPERRLVVVAMSNVVGPDSGADGLFRLIDLAVLPNLP